MFPSHDQGWYINIDKYYFDVQTADLWCTWLERFMYHVKGPFMGEPVLLSLEQRAYFRNIFGWKTKALDVMSGKPVRRYREVLKYIPRKNSKSFDCAGTALGTMVLDGEGGCKIVAIAGSKEQAECVFEPAYQNLDNDIKKNTADGMLRKYFKPYKSQRRITAKDDIDEFKTITSDESTNHGGDYHIS